MAREIKFRGQDDYNGDWIIGTPLYDKDVKGRVYIMYNYSDGIIVKPETVGQFMGLIDKNGIEIYEGDIIKNSRGDWGVIVWKSPFFETTVSEDQSSLYSKEYYLESEVIGNIYENPELLTAKA